MNIWILVFARILDYTGWMAGLVFLDFSLVFLWIVGSGFSFGHWCSCIDQSDVYKHIVKI